MNFSNPNTRSIVSNLFLVCMLIAPVIARELSVNYSEIQWVPLVCTIWIAYRVYEIIKGRSTGTLA